MQVRVEGNSTRVEKQTKLNEAHVRCFDPNVDFAALEIGLQVFLEVVGRL